MGKFINGLNPVTQVKSLGELLAGGIYVSYKILEDIINQNLYPNLPDKNFDLKMQACGSLINAARFTSDLIIGDLYLSKEEYLQRHATFWKDYGSKITAENVVDLTAQIAADFVFFKGLTSVFIYLKEIDAASKLEGHIAKVADKFKKGVDTHLANNPILVTPEGIPIRNFAPKVVECMGGITPELNNIKKIEITAKQLPRNQDKLLNVITQFQSIKVQSAESIFSLDKKGLKHILSRHHPRYWDGSLKTGQSFFSKNTKISDIIESITQVIEQNRELIITIKDNKQFQITGTVNGIQYVLGTKNGRIAQFYPLLK